MHSDELTTTVRVLALRLVLGSKLTRDRPLVKGRREPGNPGRAVEDSPVDASRTSHRWCALRRGIGSTGVRGSPSYGARSRRRATASGRLPAAAG